MERVQFQQEQMLEELKDLVEKKIFTEKETKHIIRKRTAFETALVRRVAKKADFLRYASYEMSLEQLRRKRVERMKAGPSPPTVSDYALVRRQFHIFERALKKFKSDVGLWIQYIQVAKREGARTLVGRITARALQLNPNKAALYILAASHELDHQSPSTARTLLQRGIRLNPESIELWREYVRMELGFIESLRRRWDVLGIDAGDKGKGKAPDDAEGIDEEQADDSKDIGAASRQDIMQGAIVKSVLTSAVQALPKIELFTSLKSVIAEYPCQPALQQALLDFLHDLLKTSLPCDARSVRLLADRFLTPGLHGEMFVEGLRRANEAMMQSIGQGNREDLMQAYVAFVEEWCSASIDEHLKYYLVSSVRSLISQEESSPSLLSGHLRLMKEFCDKTPGGPAKRLRTARKYTIRAPKSAHVWYERLEAERELAEGRGVVDKVWAEARRSVEGTREELERIWTWGLSWEESGEERLATYEGLLKESMRHCSVVELREDLLIGYVRAVAELRAKPNTGINSKEVKGPVGWMNSIVHMDAAYLITGRVWDTVFRTVERAEWGSEIDDREKVLGVVFEKWRRKEEGGARVEWARWLLEHGKGKEAGRIIEGDLGWKGLLDRQWVQGNQR